MECGECGVVGECWVTFFIYLLVVVDEIFGVVAVGGVSEYAKSSMCISVVVFATACGRTADTFAIDIRTSSNVFRRLSG